MQSRTNDAAAAVRRGVDNVESGMRRGVDKMERGIARVQDNASSALHRGVEKVENYTAALDNYILAQATRLRNDIAPLLPTISYTGAAFGASLPLSFYFNSLSIKRVVGVQDYAFPTNVVPISLLRFLIDTIRVAAAVSVTSRCHFVSCRVVLCHVMSCRIMSCHARHNTWALSFGTDFVFFLFFSLSQSPMLNAYFYTNPRLGMGIRWAVYTLLQPLSFACNTIAVKMLSQTAPVTANEVKIER